MVVVDYPHPKQAGPKIPLCLTQESSHRQSKYSLVCGLSISKEKGAETVSSSNLHTAQFTQIVQKKLTTPAGQPASVI